MVSQIDQKQLASWYIFGIQQSIHKCIDIHEVHIYKIQTLKTKTIKSIFQIRRKKYIEKNIIVWYRERKNIKTRKKKVLTKMFIIYR